MKITVNGGALITELSLMQKVLERKNTIPVLTNVHLTADAQTLTIRATDMDVTLIAAVPATIIQPGEMLVNGRKLFEANKLLPANEEVELSLDKAKEKNGDNRALLTFGKTKFRLPVLREDTSFPAAPKLGLAKLKCRGVTFTRWIDQVKYAITNEEGRYTLAGAKLEVTTTGTTMVTTDGHRLALLRSDDLKSRRDSDNLDVLIPRKTLMVIEAALADAEQDGEVRLGVGDNEVYFQTGERVLVSRLLSGQFPNYEMVIPKDLPHLLEIETDALNAALRRAQLCADDRSHAVRLTFTDNALIVSGESSETGRGEDVVPIEYSGEQIDVGFNAGYLLDFLNVIRTEKVTLGIKDGNAQVELRPLGSSDDYRYIVMPMRL